MQPSDELHSLSVKRRILKELRETEGSYEYSAALIDDNDIYNWKAKILGPSDSPYEYGFFSLSITLPKDYPLSPPTVRFTTKVYHPNVNDEGIIGLTCLERERWPIAYNISTVLVCIRALLHSPDMEFILEPKVADVYRTNPNEYNRIAKKWTDSYAV